jgi:hypothetical protein
MESPIITIFLSLAIGLFLLSNLGVAIFGIKNIINGKHKIQQILFFFIPVLAFAVSYLIAGSLDVAAILALLIMLALMFLGILISGSRGLISNF